MPLGNLQRTNDDVRGEGGERTSPGFRAARCLLLTSEWKIGRWCDNTQRSGAKRFLGDLSMKKKIRSGRIDRRKNGDRLNLRGKMATRLTRPRRFRSNRRRRTLQFTHTTTIQRLNRPATSLSLSSDGEGEDEPRCSSQLVESLERNAEEWEKNSKGRKRMFNQRERERDERRTSTSSNCE